MIDIEQKTDALLALLDKLEDIDAEKLKVQVVRCRKKLKPGDESVLGECVDDAVYSLIQLFEELNDLKCLVGD